MSDSPWYELEERLEANDVEAVRELFEEWSESDRTHVASHLSTDQLGSLLDVLGAEAGAELIECLPLSQAVSVIETVEP